MFSLKESFYTIKEKNWVSESHVDAVIGLNVNHDIYKGHFPEQPIVPGVCQVQIIKEFLEDLMGKKLQMITGDNIKFTGMIIPTQNPQVNFTVNYKVNGEEILCEAKLFFGETIFTKYKGKFKVI